MTQSMIPKRQFDVAIFVATEDEAQAVLQQGEWSVEQDANNGLIHVTCLKTNQERIIRLALRKLPLMGAEACVLEVSQFMALHPCRLVAMVGVCAGNPKKKIKRGDIIIPGKVASISNGKEIEDKKGQYQRLPANRFHALDTDICKALENFQKGHWGSVVADLTKNYPKLCKPQDPPKLHYAEDNVMAQVFHVRAYSEPFKDLVNFADRNVHALEMESAALAYATREYKTPWLVIKGVQDVATIKKNDRYRKFCAWASFRTLKEFLVHHLDDYWQDKVHVLAQTSPSLLHDKEVTALIDAYRKGDYDRATRIGKATFERKSYEKRIWPAYLKVLMRCSEYQKCADLIDIADFYIQQYEDPLGPECYEYKIRKAEYYWRIGYLNVADKLLIERIDQLTNDPRLHDNKELNQSLAEAYYVRGMVQLTRYRLLRLPRTLNDSYYYFNKAVELDMEFGGKKYWAFIHLLLAGYLRDGVLNEDMVRHADKRLGDALNDPKQKKRPAPRIYQLRLSAIKVAARKKDFAYLRKIINKDKSILKKQLTLPPDFFGEFEQDCKLLFESHQNQRDRLLSLIYDWASVVRKED